MSQGATHVRIQQSSCHVRPPFRKLLEEESKAVCLRTDIGMAGTGTIFCLHQGTGKGPWGKVLPIASTRIIGLIYNLKFMQLSLIFAC